MKKENDKLEKKKQLEQIEFLTLEDSSSEEQIKKKSLNKKHKKKSKPTAKRKDKEKNKTSKSVLNQKTKVKKIFAKRFIFTVVMILIFFIVVYMNIIQKALIRNEMQDLEEMIRLSEIDYNQVEKKLNRTITIGGYKKVERAFKNYLQDIVITSKQIHFLTNKEKLSNVLSADNLKSDGPIFKNTEQYLKKTKESLNDTFSNLINLLNEDKINQYASRQNLSMKYKQFYEELSMDKNKSLFSMQESLKKSLNYYNNIFDTLDTAIKFLKVHKTWKIENEKLVFSSSKDFKEYNEIIKTLNE